MPYPNVGFQITTKRRDELVHQILNDVFREKVAGFFVSRRHDYVMRPLLSCEGPRRTWWGGNNTGFGYILWGYSVCELKQEREKGNLIASGSEIPDFFLLLFYL